MYFKLKRDDLYYIITQVFISLHIPFVYVVVRAQVPRMTLDELFEQKGDVAKSVMEELEKVHS